MNDKNFFFGRFQTYRPKYVNAGTYPTLFYTQSPNYSWVFTDTHVFSPNLINIFSTGGNRDALTYGPAIDGKENVPAADIVAMLGLQGVNQQGLKSGGGSPVFAVSGYSSISTAAAGTCSTTRTSISPTTSLGRRDGT